MKSVFLAGSRKFFEGIEMILDVLTESKIKVSTAGKWKSSNKDTPESERTALLNAFKKIDKSDILYVYCSKEGYIGKTVAMEVAYAYSKKKEIVSSHKIKELSARSLVSKTMRLEEFTKYCKR